MAVYIGGGVGMLLYSAWQALFHETPEARFQRLCGSGDRRYEDVVKAATRKCLTSVNEHGSSAAHFAAVGPSPKTLLYLCVRLPPIIVHRNQYMQTPLHLLVLLYNARVCDGDRAELRRCKLIGFAMLLALGVPPYARDVDGDTALDILVAKDEAMSSLPESDRVTPLLTANDFHFLVHNVPYQQQPGAAPTSESAYREMCIDAVNLNPSVNVCSLLIIELGEHLRRTSVDLHEFSTKVACGRPDVARPNSINPFRWRSRSGGDQEFAEGFLCAALLFLAMSEGDGDRGAAIYQDPHDHLKSRDNSPLYPPKMP